MIYANQTRLPGSSCNVFILSHLLFASRLAVSATVVLLILMSCTKGRKGKVVFSVPAFSFLVILRNSHRPRKVWLSSTKDSGALRWTLSGWLEESCISFVRYLPVRRCHFLLLIRSTCTWIRNGRADICFVRKHIHIGFSSTWHSNRFTNIEAQ